MTFILVNALLCIFFPQHGTTASIPQELLDKASLGDADAQNSIGSMYIKGDEIKKDSNWAKYWYKKAVSLGSKEAGAALNKMHTIR